MIQRPNKGVGMLIKLGHAILSGVVRPILHKFGYDVECTSDWVPAEKRDWRLLDPYREQICRFVPGEMTIATAPKIIWQFWWQGLDNAPVIVKRCMESVSYFMGADYKIVVIDRDNIEDYVHVDKIIQLRHDNGEMTHTHFSDYLRAKILSEKGGVWIDATVFLSARIPKTILDANYFIFKSGPFAADSEISDIDDLDAITEFSHGASRLLPSSWFLVARKGSPINQLFVAFEIAYWTRERRLYNYYLYHLLTTYAICANRYCRDEFVSAPTELNFKPHLLMFHMKERYAASLVDRLFAITPIHKMTYKYNDIPSMGETLLGKLISGELLEYAKRGQ